MLPYQRQYLENVREIARLSDFYGIRETEFERWYAAQRKNSLRIRELKAQNMELLTRNLFPVLDTLHEADSDTIAGLDEFSRTLMDWRENLDCGVYVLIHDALLSLYRTRRDRNGIIRELYNLGMGYYYQDRTIQGVPSSYAAPFRFQNELVFTEAGSYLRFFPELEDEETKGYVIRSLANIAICTSDRKKRIAISSRILKLVKDEYYRSLAPGLPWDSFLRRTQQQMCANRSVLSRGNLSTDELASVLEACHEVYAPEKAADNPNIRWLWPYYEMEFSCGFVDLQTTLDRMERLMSAVPYDEFGASGLYANVQLPIYYGNLLQQNPGAKNEDRHLRTLENAYEKMLKTLLTLPWELIDDNLLFDLTLVFTSFYEVDGMLSYREVTTRLMQRYSGRLYIHSQKVGNILAALCSAIDDADPSFFSDIPVLQGISSPAERRKALLAYARDCGHYHDFGLFKMNLDRLRRTRKLFEREDQMLQLHVVSGAADLRRHHSTEIFADIALGHHRWYNGADGYPAEYERTASPYRQMTDVVAVAAYLAEEYRGDLEFVIRDILRLERKRFSPIVTSRLTEFQLQAQLAEILDHGDELYYRELFHQLLGGD